MGEVLRAKDEGAWRHVRYLNDRQEVDFEGWTVEVKKGTPVLNMPLHELFTIEEWKILSKFNEFTFEQVHDARLPLTSSGKSFIAVRSTDLTDEMTKCLKTIGVKARIFESLDDLEIENEDVFFERL